MQKRFTKTHTRILCMIMVLAMIFAQLPTQLVFAEEATAYEWAGGDSNPQLDFHNEVSVLSYEEARVLFGMEKTDLFQVLHNGEVIWDSTEAGAKELAGDPATLLFVADEIYQVQLVKVVIDSIWPPKTHNEYETTHTFTVRLYDNLTVNSNVANLVTVDGAAVTDTLTTKVYRIQKPEVVVGMGDLVNHTVSATLNGEQILTDAGSYVFENGMTKDETIDVVYVEDTESQISLGEVSGFENVEFPVTAQAEEVVTIVATPKEGYFIDAVTVKNGEDDVVVEGSYANGVWTGTFTTTASKSHYKVNCVSKPVVVLNGNTISYNEMMELDAVKAAIYARIDKNQSAPIFDDIAALTFEYNATNFVEDNWQALDYVPTGMSAIADHAFGTNSEETIRISYVGDGKQFIDGSIIFTVNLSDERNANAAIDVNEAVSAVYGTFTNDDILAMLLDGRKGVYDMETDTLIDVATVKLATDVSTLPVGEYDIVVRFDGDVNYAECEKTVKITILTAPADVIVNSMHIKPGQAVTMDDMIVVDPAKAGHMSFVLGLDAVDEETVMLIDISNMLHVNDALRPAVDAVLDTVNNKSITVAELEELMHKIGEIDAQIDLTYVDKAISILKQVEELEGVGQLMLTLTSDGTIDTSNVGAYIVGSMITDVNYEFDADFNYLLITPDMTQVTLAFDEEVGHVLIVDDVLANMYDMGAHVVEEEYADANDKLINVFFGVTEAGDVYIENAAPALIGAYTQVAYINDIGNTMYYAMPIVRAYLITPELANVVFVDEAGNESDNFNFVYDGEVKALTAIATDRNGATLPSENLTVKYVGVSTDGSLHNGADAPSKPGVYTVMAMYKDDAEEIYGTGIALLTIEQADSEFAVSDTTVEFDGEQKFIDVINPNNLEYFSIIVNGENVNILIPESLGVDPQVVPVDEIVDMLLELIAQIPEIPEIPEISEIPEAPDAQEMEAIIAELTEILNNIKDYDVELNGAKPSEIGEYDVFALAFGVNHKATLVEAVLTITEVEEEPEDPTDPSEPEDPSDPTDPTDPEEPENTCKCCDKCTGAEGCECFCGECDFCEKDEDPTDPTDPEDPTDPSEPEEDPTDPTDPEEDPTKPTEPKDDDATDTPVLGYEGSDSVAIWGFVAMIAVAAIAFEIYVLKSKKFDDEE